MWNRKPQERTDQKYLFSGRFYCTKGVSELLPYDEILMLYHDVRDFAIEQKGIDYLQVYSNETGQRLFFIDNLDEKMLESGNYDNEHNYCTLLLPEEY